MEPTSPGIVCFGEFRLEADGPRLYRHSDPVQLGGKSLATLAFLVSQRPRVVSKNELLDKVWRERRSLNTVEQAVRQLRDALGDSASEPSYVETVPGEGYRFVADLTDAPSERIAPQPGTPKVPPPSGNAQAPGRLIPRKWILSAIAICLVTAGPIGYLRRPVPNVTRVAITRNAAVATDDVGNVLWRYPFPAPVMETSSFDMAWRSQVVDLDGDGTPEILLATELESSQDEHVGAELLCLSSGGKLLWRYRPSIHLEFRTGDFNGSWRIAWMVAVPEKRGMSVWLAVDHTLWWPAFIARLSPAGSSDIVFTSSGYIGVLDLLSAPSGTYVLAAGINNEYRQAFLAALAANGSPSTSPQSEGSQYQCVRGCPAGRPYRFVLLPRSELNRATDYAYNRADHIASRPGGITVSTAEVWGPMKNTRLLWDLSDNLQPQAVAYASNYRDLHRRFEEQGLIHHRMEDCPEPRTPALVTVFDQNGARRTVPVPWSNNF